MKLTLIIRDNSRNSRRLSRSAQRGFTMIEIAIALAVIAFALVAIIGVLPIGLNVQRDNRAETIINQDATYWLEAIRSGAQGLDDLMNYVERITVTNRLTGAFTVFENANLPGVPPPTFANGAEIIGLLSTPALDGTNVEAIVRTISGPATEKFTRADAPGAELVFRYRLTAAVAVVDPAAVQDFNSAVAGGTPEPMSTLFDIQLQFNWPVFGKNTRGTRQKTFRSMASRYLVATNIASVATFYYLTP
jgi:prepilin-type N-terminal cleavage/methylation domain-containing protein